MLYITDDMDKDVVTVKAENDSGQTVNVAVVKINDDTVELYQPGDGQPSVSDSSVTAAGSGYFNIWLHHMQTGPAYITNLCAEGSVGGDKNGGGKYVQFKRCAFRHMDQYGR